MILRIGEKVRDVKTGNAVSALTYAHARQGSIYGYALKRVPVIDYISKKGVTSFEVTDVDYHIRQIQIAARSLEIALSYSDDILECCQLVYPDLDHWMCLIWSGKPQNQYGEWRRPMSKMAVYKHILGYIQGSRVCT